MKPYLRKILIVIGWIIIWQIIAVIINKPVLLASFTDCCQALITLLGKQAFYQAIFHSIALIVCGIVLGYLLGILIGYLSARVPLLQEILEPILLLMKSVPVACFAILVLIWVGSNSLADIVSFIVIFPQVYYATIHGIQNQDQQLVEMAKINRMKKTDQLLYLDRIAITPYLLTISSNAVSMGVKSSIAAEIIGLARNSIGQQLYYDKLYLNTAELFCYSFIIVLISFLLEKIVIMIIRKLGGRYDSV